LGGPVFRGKTEDRGGGAHSSAGDVFHATVGGGSPYIFPITIARGGKSLGC